MERHLIPYDPPSWQQDLTFKPKYKVQLAMHNTPVHQWNLPGIPDEFKVDIKRQDMTGSTLSGNKVEKLEYLLAEAIATGCKHVLACGSPLSNLCRTVALACRQLDLVPHLFLMTETQDISEIGYRGNLLLSRLAGADIHLVRTSQEQTSNVYPVMQKFAQKILEETGEKCFLVPKGASNLTGLFGSMDIIQQLKGQLDQYDDIVLPCGSGGTTAGVCIANYLVGSPCRVHGMLINYNKEHAHNHVNGELRALGLDDVRSEDILDVVDEHIGGGYSVASQEQLDFMLEVCCKSGVVLDRTYTGKAAWGMVQEMRNNPARFKGRRVLFIHTGGMLGLFDGEMEKTLLKQDDKITVHNSTNGTNQDNQE